MKWNTVNTQVVNIPFKIIPYRYFQKMPACLKLVMKVTIEHLLLVKNQPSIYLDLSFPKHKTMLQLDLIRLEIRQACKLPCDLDLGTLDALADILLLDIEPKHVAGIR